jgi:hypothetical protein
VSDFLAQWDSAIAKAHETGMAVSLHKYHRVPADPTLPYEDVYFTVVARTMHPSFMGGQVPKHDPTRDKR